MPHAVDVAVGQKRGVELRGFFGLAVEPEASGQLEIVEGHDGEGGSREERTGLEATFFVGII